MTANTPEVPMKPSDIVAFLINGRFIVRDYRRAADVRIITRAHMQMMADMDLGPQWQSFADAPAIGVVNPGHRVNTLERVYP